MPSRRTIRRRYGQLEVFEKSLVYNGVCMFVQQDPERVPDLIVKLDSMLNEAFMAGRAHEKHKISRKFEEFTDALK